MKDHKLIKANAGYLSVQKKPTQRDLEEYYKKTYFQSEEGTYQTSYSDEELEFFEAKIKQKFTRCQEIQPRQVGTFLDIGAGEGFTLEFYREKGWDISGYDYSSFGVSRHNPSSEPYVKLGDVNLLVMKAINDGKKFDLIYMTNVLEHLIDPEMLLEKLHCLLSKDGLACITVPNDFSIIQKCLVEKKHVDRNYWVAVPDHLHYFNYESLVRLLKEKDYECHDIIADFPIDWFLFNEYSNYVESPEVGKKLI